ncbi:MAG: PAS domain S-box protein, partial [Chitinophagaceae bacterium]
HKDGSPLYTEVTVSAIIDDAGDKTGTVSVIRDITERKFTEQKLQRLTTYLEEEVKLKAAELNNIFERITDAFIALDNNWNYTYVNKKAAELHNRPIEALLGKNMLEEYPDVANGEFYEALCHAKETNLAKRVQLYYSKTDKWFEDLIYPSGDGISVYYHDITDSKKAELALQRTHEKLSYHINNTPMGVVEFDEDLKIIQWSDRATQIFGWTKDDLLGDENLINTMVYAEDRERVAGEIRSILQKDFTGGFTQFRNYTKDGRVIYCEWYNSILTDDQDKVIGIMSLVHDVTKRIEIKKELEEAEVKFRSLVEQSMVGVYIIQADKFTYINPRLEELTGYTSEEVIDKFNIFDVVYHEDRQLSDTVISIMQTNDAELSPKWKEKYEGHIPTREELFKEEVFSALNYLKLRKIKKMIIENQQEMLHPLPAEDMLLLLQTHQHLKQMEIELTRQLGTVIYK